MKHIIASLITIGTVASASGFIPTWLVKKYTEVIAVPSCVENLVNCEFKEHFRAALPTKNNEEAARGAQRSFGDTFGRWSL